MAHRISGEIVLAAPVTRLGSRLRVMVEDVSRIDAAAIIVAETIIALDEAGQEGDHVPFALELADPDPAASYSVRVHLDTDGSGEVTAGDQISTISNPVSGDGSSNRLEIALTAL